jgi:hypothetical protein
MFKTRKSPSVWVFRFEFLDPFLCSSDFVLQSISCVAFFVLDVRSLSSWRGLYHSYNEICRLYIYPQYFFCLFLPSALSVSSERKIPGVLNEKGDKGPIQQCLSIHLILASVIMFLSVQIYPDAQDTSTSLVRPRATAIESVPLYPKRWG